jgi:ferric-dicitrate binding protein FerR (iron transport regulator)
MGHQQESDNNIKVLLQRYLQGTATAEEKKRVEYWYSTLSDQPPVRLSPEEREVLRQSVISGILQKTTPVRAAHRKWIRYAAAVLLLVGAGSVMYTYYSRMTAPTLISAANGSTRSIILPDSSRVMLNAGSTLQIPAGFGRKERTLTLSGEAFFDVRRDPVHPFTIHHGNLTTTVLGTTFDIRAYPGDENVKVAVASGRVQVDIAGAATRRFLLEHHETLQYNISGGDAYKGREDTARIGLWQKQVLDFNGYTLSGMVAELQRQYPVNLQLYTTPADTSHYSIVFHREKIDDILRVLTSLTGMTYKQTKDKIIIYSKTYAK